MRTPLIARLVLLAVTLGLSAALALPVSAQASTAQVAAAPTAGAVVSAQAGFPTVLTKNKIYRSGSVGTIDCSPTEPRAGSAAAAKTYMLQVYRCVNQMWARKFKAVGWTYRVPKIVIRTSGPKTPCGRLTKTYWGHYCPHNQTIYILLTSEQIKQPFPLVLAKTMAHEIAHHVQQRSGMLTPYYNLAYRARTKTAKNLLSHRVEQQAECFAGVFLSGAQDSLPVDFEEWEHINNWAVKNADDALHGKGRNQVFWLERGFQSGSPAACNTWVVSNARVA
ncbi:neutral zinc metallopeptidase [Acrocarpospora catenulata]|uniref:neutral zinc metallopeptidase n=1 Tax=Acrocarpospora catenulata TaxID=2836182 RepID=UPI001BDA0F3C|nr:neutral zinc metallopeptidase [Acrocarpospora catenulata]